LQCDHPRSKVAESVLSAYRARFKSASTRDEALTRIPVADKFYAFLIFEEGQADLIPSIDGLESDDRAIAMPKLKLTPSEYKELECLGT